LKIGRKLQYWSLKYNHNWTWQLEFPDRYFQWQRTAKESRRCFKEEGKETRRCRKQKIKDIQCVIWFCTRLSNLYTAWMGPLVRVMYSNLTQSVFRLERVKSSSSDCTAKIPVDSNASCFIFCSSGSSSPEVVEFCPTLRLVYAIARA
jgi:hypothetical protein